MCTWPELHTCTLCMKRKSIKENETTVNTLLNQFTYKLKEKSNKNKKHTKKDKTERNKFTWLTLSGKKRKGNIQEMLSKTNDLSLSFIIFFRLPWKVCKFHLNLSKCASLLLHSNPSQLANDFGKFFRDKINSIRLEIARRCCASGVSDSGVSDSHLALYGPSFSEFRLLSETEVL